MIQLIYLTCFFAMVKNVFLDAVRHGAVHFINKHSMWGRYEKSLIAAILIGVGIVIALPLFSMTYYTMVRTYTADFWATCCHEINPAVVAWRSSTHVNNQQGFVADCMDCHYDIVHNDRVAAMWSDENHPIYWDYFLPGFVPVLRFQVSGFSCQERHP